MKGWTADGDRIELLQWQADEVRDYMKWGDGPRLPFPYKSRFMFSREAMAEKPSVVIATIDRLSDHKHATGSWFPGEKNMKRFRVYRPDPPENYREGGFANAPDEVQFEGVEFSDGTVAVRWLTQYRSTSIWSSFDELMKVHGHMEEYGTIIGWLDD